MPPGGLSPGSPPYMTPGGSVFVRGGFNWARGGVSLFVCVFVCGVLRTEEVLNIEDRKREGEGEVG